MSNERPICTYNESVGMHLKLPSLDIHFDKLNLDMHFQYRCVFAMATCRVDVEYTPIEPPSESTDEDRKLPSDIFDDNENLMPPKDSYRATDEEKRKWGFIL